jgi:hypothetical protein
MKAQSDVVAAAGGPAAVEGDDEEDREDQYDHFDLDAYASRKEREQQGTLRGDPNSKAPISNSWLSWNVKLPNLFATFTIALIIMYEVLVIVSLFVQGVRSVMVLNGVMWLLCALNAVSCGVLGIIVFVTKKDLSVGQMTGVLNAFPTSAAGGG